MATIVLPEEACGGGVLESHGDSTTTEARRTQDISFSIKGSRKA